MKKNNILLLATLVLSGCVTAQEPLYYWGTTPATYHKLVLEPGDATLAEHEKALQDTIDQSVQKGKRVPPGVYCELGYLQFKKGRKVEALSLYDAEIKTYPESSVFVERLKAKLQETDTPAKP